MAIETMALFNLVCEKSRLDPVLRDLVARGNVALRDAFSDIQESDFGLSTSEDNAAPIVDMNQIRRIPRNDSLKETRGMLREIMSFMAIEGEIRLGDLQGDYAYGETRELVREVHREQRELKDRADRLEKELKQIESFQCEDCLEGLTVDFGHLMGLKNFMVKWGRLTPENRQKVVRNYENIPALFMDMGTETTSKQLYLVIAPLDLAEEVDRILRSLKFLEIFPPVDLMGTPGDMKKAFEARKTRLREELAGVKEELLEKSRHRLESLKTAYSRLQTEEILEGLRGKIAVTEHFAYLSGWVPSAAKEALEETLSAYGPGLILTFRDLEELGHKIGIPTSLKNPGWSAPFEELVRMYGIPSYGELDPTGFFAVSYMILFGAMFGDLGQGLLIFLAGLLIRRKKSRAYGGILSRLGLMSMAFGVLYDSFFGYEEIISHYFPGGFYLRPLENIETVLFAAIALGIVLLYVALGYSIFNKLKQKNYVGGFFGSSGIAGTLLFTALILYVLAMFAGGVPLPSWMLSGVILLTATLIFFKEPLGNLVVSRRPLHGEPPGEYYVESGFNLFETFLSMLSNGLSFIRVGAFALNHVGLFIAFHTMARIIGTLGGSVAMFILGNLLVIFLEGLIVLIQGLRLVYYELFSKYYEGEGTAFEPHTLTAEVD